MIPYWIPPTLAALPAFAWMFLGVGGLAALALLPHKDWRDRPLVIACALAFGPAAVTAWMFVLGTLGGRDQSPLLTFPNVIAGSIALALIFALFAWRKRAYPVPHLGNSQRHRPHTDERLVVGLIALALAIVWMIAAYWPFIHYDPIWVYGYQGRLYMLLGYIPPEIGYYPPFLSLQYAYGQLAYGGVIDDHAARAGLPFLHAGSVLMVYALGRRLFNVRTGIIAAGLWALYPHVGLWSSVGDLEIPLTFGFTGASLFFLMAWTSPVRRDRLYYGALSGAFLGVAMWTKPTAGAFILGVVLLVVLDFLRVRGDWRAWLPRFEVAASAGLASIPLGALWYVRNIAFGHEPITFPNDFWLTQALRSGAEFGWLVLALLLLTAYLALAPLTRRPDWRPLALGWLAIALALIPTTLQPRRMTPPEFALLAVGIGLWLWVLLPYARRYATAQAGRHIAVIGWALALAFPYFVNWFYNYSYHYRLSFPIVPLLLLPSALILAQLVKPDTIAGWRPARRRLYHALLALICLPGVVVPFYHYEGGWTWFWTDRYPDDFARLASFNAGLAYTVRDLQADIGDAPAVIVAPGLQRLPFFFPLYDVRIDDAPTELWQLADADYFIYTQEARWYYEELGLPAVNQVTGSMARSQVMDFRRAHGDSSFFSRTYRLHDPERRFAPPGDNFTLVGDEVIFGGFARLAAYRLTAPYLSADDPPRLTLVFEALAPADNDYSIYVHLRDADDNLIATWDAQPVPGEFAHYATHLWEAGEFVHHTRRLRLDDLPQPGEYRLVAGFYDLVTGQRVPAHSQQPLVDGWVIPSVVTLAPASAD